MKNKVVLGIRIEDASIEAGEGVDVYIDNELLISTKDIELAITLLREWHRKTPFWISTSLFINIYKNKEDRIQNKNKSNKEENLLFRNGDKEYLCLRCRLPSEIVGFCQNCYNDVYGLNKQPIKRMKLSDVHCNEKFITIVESNPEYTEKIRQSIMKDGMKNPIIVDSDNRILIGHHRFYIAKELGWEYINVQKNEINFNHGLFYEGKGWGLFVARLDGKLFLSTTVLEDVIPLIRDFNMYNIGNILNIEAYINIGSDIRLRNIFIPERGDVVDPTWYDWYVRKFNKKPKIGKFS